MKTLTTNINNPEFSMCIAYTAEIYLVNLLRRKGGGGGGVAPPVHVL